jgi:hypothetical protein
MKEEKNNIYILFNKLKMKNNVLIIPAPPYKLFVNGSPPIRYNPIWFLLKKGQNSKDLDPDYYSASLISYSSGSVRIFVDLQ